MKSVLGWLIVLAVIAGGAGFALFSFYQTTREQAYTLALSSLKREFMVNTSGLFPLEGELYRKEIGPHLSRYFRDLNKLAKEYPEIYDLDREKKKNAVELERGRMSESQTRQRDERIDISKDLFERMRDGQYRPLYTASDKNFRFDIYDLTPAKVEGENQVKVSFVHWGPFGENHRPGEGPVSYKGIFGNIEAEQEKGKPVKVPQIDAPPPAPPALQIAPERWVREFPPGIEIGYYNLPQFPKVAKSIKLSFGYGVRTIGGSENFANLEFPAVPIPEAWKVPEGQAWEANERFASDEELQAAGATPTQGP